MSVMAQIKYGAHGFYLRLSTIQGSKGSLNHFGAASQKQSTGEEK